MYTFRTTSVCDPYLACEGAKLEYDIDLIKRPPQKNTYSAIIIATAYQKFIGLGIKKITKLGNKDSIRFVVKSMFAKKVADIRL